MKVHKKQHALLRQISALFYNPLAMLIAGRAHSPYAIVVHVGRRSGRPYRTPVVAHRATHGFAIPLPYGDDVDWCRNILAAGGCIVVWKGRPYRTVEPRLVNRQDVRGELPSLLWKTLAITGTRHYLRLRLADAGG